ncbi:hypothetical protein NMY3_03383 [Candidatus Nitrosocosmicus oleophilus]|uniref:Uncharacterized protein n=1 Tax=Candidatus Nitrosocosmicus oleophilus TaxID=1353260 RepID=A0A654M4G4_9ARCH|nr:hypothetical protein NMY3_03383 [Candidatus Nitrosocosmicus oleophilus]
MYSIIFASGILFIKNLGASYQIGLVLDFSFKVFGKSVSVSRQQDQYYPIIQHSLTKSTCRKLNQIWRLHQDYSSRTSKLL